MTALWTLAAGIVLAWAGWWWSASALDRAARVALIAVLGVTAATFNVIVPIPSIEATTTVVLCTAIVLGVRSGIGVGLVAVVGSSIAGGVGAWTLWQVIAACVVAIMGGVLGRAAGRRSWHAGSDRLLLGVVAALATITWDVVVTVGGAASYATQPGLTPIEQIVSALLLGAAFTIVHVTFSTIFTVVGGPPLLQALQRARPRLTGGIVVASRHELA